MVQQNSKWKVRAGRFILPRCGGEPCQGAGVVCFWQWNSGSHAATIQWILASRSRFNMLP